MKKAPYQFLILLLFLILNSTISYAQTDDKAENIFKESKMKFESLEDFSAQFTYSLADPRTATSVSKKGIMKTKGNMYIIQMEDQQIYCDGKSLWIYLPHENEVTIMFYDSEEDLNGNVMAIIFQLQGAKETIKYAGIEPIQNRDHHKIILTNLDTQLDFNQASLWIDVQTLLLSKTVLVDRKQTTTEYLFSAVQFNKGILDSEFVFDPSKYPDIKVIVER